MEGSGSPLRASLVQLVIRVSAFTGRCPQQQPPILALQRLLGNHPQTDKTTLFSNPQGEFERLYKDKIRKPTKLKVAFLDQIHRVLPRPQAVLHKDINFGLVVSRVWCLSGWYMTHHGTRFPRPFSIELTLMPELGNMGSSRRHLHDL